MKKAMTDEQRLSLAAEMFEHAAKALRQQMTIRPEAMASRAHSIEAAALAAWTVVCEPARHDGRPDEDDRRWAAEAFASRDAGSTD
jgi:hypothetical protein